MKLIYRTQPDLFHQQGTDECQMLAAFLEQLFKNISYRFFHCTGTTTISDANFLLSYTHVYAGQFMMGWEESTSLNTAALDLIFLYQEPVK